MAPDQVHHDPRARVSRAGAGLPPPVPRTPSAHPPEARSVPGYPTTTVTPPRGQGIEPNPRRLSPVRASGNTRERPDLVLGVEHRSGRPGGRGRARRGRGRGRGRGRQGLSPRSWTPRRVLLTRAASEQPHAAEIIRRCDRGRASSDIECCVGDRLPPLRGESERETYARAKSTLAVVVAPPSALKPAADPAQRRLAHRPRPRLPRALPVLLPRRLAGRAADHPRLRQPRRGPRADRHATPATARVTSGTAARGHEGTTFELSCYTDPLGIEHLTGSLAAPSQRVGTGAYGDDVSCASPRSSTTSSRCSRSARRPDPGPLLGQRRTGRRPVRRRHRPAARPADAPCAALASAGYRSG